MEAGQFRVSGSILDAKLVVPKQIQVDGDTLFWKVKPNAWRGVRRDILEDFMDIGRLRSPKALLGFAKRYGPLHLCPHGWPSHHAPMCSEQPAPPSSGWHYQESIERCYALAQSAAALRDAAAEIRHSRLPSDEMLNRIHPDRGCFSADMFAIVQTHSKAGKRMSPVNLAAGFVEMCLHEWVIGSGLRLQLEWSGTRWLYCYGVDGPTTTPLSAVAASLLQAIAGPEMPRPCSVCGDLHTPKRRPRGEFSYCEECNAKPQKKWALQRYSLRHRLAATKSTLGETLGATGKTPG